MPTERTRTDLDWARLRGATLPGGFELESILAADREHATFKVRVLGDAGANALAMLFGADPEAGEQQVALWETARGLRDANLARPLGAGQTQIEEANAAYVVLPRPDEALAGAITERALSREEAGDVLLAVLQGLGELHAQGLVHGRLSPEEIFAIGDAIKLSTLTVRAQGEQPRLDFTPPKHLAPESESENITPEADIWCLGATLVQILGRPAADAEPTEAAAGLPAPFDAIARRCLDPNPETRATLPQVEALFRSRGVPPPAQAQVRKPEPIAEPVVAAAVAPIPLSPPDAPFAGMTPLARASEGVRGGRTNPVWIYAAAAVLVIVVVMLLARPKHNATTAPVQTASTAMATKPAPSAWPSQTLRPDDAKAVTRSQPRKTGSVPTPSASSSQANGAVWRVILYTYAREADAQQKAKWVNEHYPGLTAETFSPKGGSPYLVVAGGHMTRDEAQRLRQKVRGLGLPHDAYIQNYRD